MICIVCGAKLSHEKKLGQYTIRHNDPQKFPEIGNTNESCTEITSLFPLTKDLVLFDPPGFLDTKGVHQEILNSYCNARMFKVGIKAKIVIMVEISSLLSSRGGSFVQVTQRLRELFQNDFRQIINSCVLVISKVHPSIYTREDIIGTIREISQQNKNLKPEEAMLLMELVEKKRIHVMPTPDSIHGDFARDMQRLITGIPVFHIAKETQVALSA